MKMGKWIGGWLGVFLCVVPAEANTYLSEPDAVICGSVTIDGLRQRAADAVTVSARIGVSGDSDSTDVELANYQLGASTSAGDDYVLRIPLVWCADDGKRYFAGDVPVPGAGGATWTKVPMASRTIRIYVRDPLWTEPQRCVEVQLTGHGLVVETNLDLGADSDHDGVYDRLETAWGLNYEDSDDTDGDGVSDRDEIGYDGDLSKYDPYDPSTGRGTDLNARSNDTDGDGITDDLEILWKLNPLRADNLGDEDEDGYLNWEEAARGTDPNDSNEVPEKTWIFVDANAPEKGRRDDVQTWSFRTIQAAVDYAIRYDEVILRDGAYSDSGDIDVEVAGKPIVIAADSNECGPGHCVIDCNNAGRAFFIVSDGNDPVVLRGLTIRDGFAPDGGAVYGEGGTVRIENCLLVHNFSEADGGALFFDGVRLTIQNATISDNTSGGRGGAIYCERGCDATIVNSILWNDVAAQGGQEVHLSDAAAWRPSDGSTAVVSYSDLLTDETSVYRGQECTFESVGSTNLSQDPCFATPGQGYWNDNGTQESGDDYWVWVDGDYHLRSAAGRWEPDGADSLSWKVDKVSSPCIDAGDPNSPIGTEPESNGSRINIGAYGGTGEASQSTNAASHEEKSVGEVPAS